MKGGFRQTLMKGVLFLGICSLFTGVAHATRPDIERITVEPQQPAPKSKVVFNVIIIGEDPLEDVRLIVQECKGDVCFVDGFNESMAMVDIDTYECEITLIHEDATYIQYWFEVKSDGVWYKYDMNKVYLSIVSDDGGDGKTPGFEVFSLIIAVLIGLLCRKRVK